MSWNLHLHLSYFRSHWLVLRRSLAFCLQLGMEMLRLSLFLIFWCFLLLVSLYVEMGFESLKSIERWGRNQILSRFPKAIHRFLEQLRILNHLELIAQKETSCPDWHNERLHVCRGLMFMWMTGLWLRFTREDSCSLKEVLSNRIQHRAFFRTGSKLSLVLRGWGLFRGVL